MVLHKKGGEHTPEGERARMTETRRRIRALVVQVVLEIAMMPLCHGQGAAFTPQGPQGRRVTVDGATLATVWRHYTTNAKLVASLRW